MILTYKNLQKSDILIITKNKLAAILSKKMAANLFNKAYKVIFYQLIYITRLT
jgi:hypothetical protein